MDPLSPFKSASAFTSPWASSPSSSSSYSSFSPSTSAATAASRHRATHSNASASASGTGTGTGYRASPLPQSASTPAFSAAPPGLAGMTSGASAWGGEEVYTPPARVSGMDGAGGEGGGPSSAGQLGGVDFRQQQQQQQYFLRVKITGVERNRKDMLLRFDASTNLPNYRATLYRNMQRSYAEFQRFAEQAQATSPQTIISALPLASSSALTDEEDDRLVRIALQRWFSRICEDPVLMRDEELRSFVESDFGYSPIPPPSARRPTGPSSAAGSVFSAALSKVVKRGPLEEDDELASAKAALEKLEVTWAGAAAGINAVGKARRAYAAASQEVGGKLISLSTVESDFGLQGAERKVGRALETVAGVHGAQSASENIVLADTLGYQALNARAAKDALVQRTQLLEDSQTASKSAIQKRRNVERLKGSSNINPAKVDDAIAEMEDANALESTLTRQLAAISTNLHLSLRQHSRFTHEDAAMALLENARLSVGFQKQALRELEIARAEVSRVGGGAVYAAAGAGTGAKTQGAGQVQVGAGGAGSGSAVRAQAQAQPQDRQEDLGQRRDVGGARYHDQTAAARPQPVQAPVQHQQHQQSTLQHQPIPRHPARIQQQQAGTQSMFLPPQHQHPSQTHQQQQQPYDPRQFTNGSGSSSTPAAHQQQARMPHHQQTPQPQQGLPRPHDPLGGQPAHGQQHPGMAQSMVLPPAHGGQQRAGTGTTGRNGGKRLDSRQAAKMLAGGF